LCHSLFVSEMHTIANHAKLHIWVFAFYTQVVAHCARYIDGGYDPNKSFIVTGVAEEESPLLLAIAALQEQEDIQKLRELEFETSNANGGVLSTQGTLVISDSVLAELENPSEVKKESHFHSLQSKNVIAIDAVQNEMEKEKAIAKFEEVKFTTENEMDALMKNL
jgi:hypothetical protein